MRTPKIAELIAGEIRREIVLGQLREGETLPAEPELSEQLGVSRPTIREALRILESELLIDVKRGARHGAVVKTPSSEAAARYASVMLQYQGTTLAEIFEARNILESLCARLAALRATSEEIDVLRRLNNEPDEDDSSDIYDFYEFHYNIIDLAGNRTIQLVARIVASILESVFRRTRTDAQEFVGILKEACHMHDQLLDAFEARDGDAAQRIWAEHLGTSASQFMRDFQPDDTLDLLSSQPHDAFRSPRPFWGSRSTGIFRNTS